MAAPRLNLLGGLDCDHIRGAGLMQWKPGCDGDQIAALDEAELDGFLLRDLEHDVRALKARHLHWIDAPHQTKHFYGIGLGTDGDDRMRRAITRDHASRTA